MKKLLKYDFFYLFKTSKFLVIGAVFVMFSVISPLTTKYINEILSFLLNGADSPIEIPVPTIYTAYSQYISDLYEICFMVVLFVVVSIFIRDKTKGLLPLILSKPINRTKYVLSKYISVLVLILGSLLLGYLTFSYYTYFLFDELLFLKGFYMILLYFLDLVFVSAIALFCATHLKSYILAILGTFGGYIIVSILAIFDFVPVVKYLPGLIKANIGNILMSTYSVEDILLNVLVTVLITGGLLFFSIQRMKDIDI